MKKQKHTWLLISTTLLLILMACHKKSVKHSGYHIDGKLNGIDLAKVQLLKLDLVTNEPVVVSQGNMVKGQFSFKGKVESPYLHTIAINDSLKIHLFLENGTIEITGDIHQLDQVEVKGSREDSLFRSIAMDDIFDRKKGVQLILDHPDYILSAFAAFYNFQINNYPADSLALMMSRFSPEVKESVYYQHLDKLYQTLKKVAFGAPAPPFTLPDTQGDSISLSDYKGKFVLLDFWASWCAPCRAANPTLVEVQKTYGGDNFTILGISVDKDKESWLKAVKDDQLTWPNLGSAKGWAEVSDQYGVKAVPQNFLIDPKGNIIDKNIEPEKMISTLKNVLTK